MQVSRFRHSPPSDNKCRLIGFGLAAESRIAESNSGRTYDARMANQLMPVAFGACSRTVSVYPALLPRARWLFALTLSLAVGCFSPAAGAVEYWRSAPALWDTLPDAPSSSTRRSVQFLWRGVGPWRADHWQGRADLHQGAVSEEKSEMGHAVRRRAHALDRDRWHVVHQVNPAWHDTSITISNAMVYSTWLTAGGIFLTGLVTDDTHAKDTGVAAARGAADSAILYGA